MAIIKLNKENFESTINEKGKMLVDFWATWCGPCSMIAPVLEELATEENIKVGKVNVDEESELAMKYDIDSIPTIILMEDGKEKNRTIGYMDKEELKKFYEESDK